ncbi:late competence development ComFB family protein [Thiocystis violascens]|uniref:Late competence development protein ComFB n=1 Tax=Thiocystis violascens (strain ATCC 17096 / DSM 198 / 6111) TaxID=765911 RepID=I3Y605_THIV6|nr:late competence development ComFB family protein [Thiocystis violascens]AFL72423.1 Late competence development protein ComFB [Thiocystis violascens DSM 198]
MLSSIGNYFERLVMERIHGVLGENGSEFDTTYIEDLACVALNYLPPRYVRHAVDLASHLSDSDHRNMREEVSDAVNFAIATTQRRQGARDENLE